MPDPLRQTISATETPALFNASPYVTRWMLYQRFANNVPIDKEADNRMDWGKRLEPVILPAIAEQQRLEVEANRGEDGAQVYVRRGLLGCTRDARIISPDIGPGACEVKVVFDYATWMREWGGGTSPPRQIEVQLQQQMKVGDGESSEPYAWGMIAVFVCGDLHYFRRKPIPELWDAMDLEADRFFEIVAKRKEPDPFGAPVEVPLLNQLFPPPESNALDYTNEPDAIKRAEDVVMMKWHAEQRLGHEKAEKALKAQMMALGRGHSEILLPHGIKVGLKQQTRAGHMVKPSSFTNVSCFVPEGIPDGTLNVGGQEI